MKAVLKWACVVCGAVLIVAAVFPKIEMNPRISLSLVMILVCSALLR